MNPYESTLQTTEPSGLPRVVRNATLFGGITGVFVWFTLFLAVGFDSDFGNKLTRLYARDLTGLNFDWMIFAAIIVVASTLSFTFSGVVTRFTGTLGAPGKSPVLSRIYLILVPPATILVLMGWLCLLIDTDAIRPAGYSVLATICCSWPFSSAILNNDQ
ncbi:MAG: hypothetical protein Aurels2KO_02190 [Aureliella sp.]